MKAAAILLNFFFPGVGSLVIGKSSEGAIQLVLYIMGLILTLTLIGAIIGVPMMLAAWIWGLVTAASYQETTQVVHVVHSGYPAHPGSNPYPPPPYAPPPNTPPPQTPGA